MGGWGVAGCAHVRGGVHVCVYSAWDWASGFCIHSWARLEVAGVVVHLTLTSRFVGRSGLIHSSWTNGGDKDLATKSQLPVLWWSRICFSRWTPMLLELHSSVLHFKDWRCFSICLLYMIVQDSGSFPLSKLHEHFSSFNHLHPNHLQGGYGIKILYHA